MELASWYSSGFTDFANHLLNLNWPTVAPGYWRLDKGGKVSGLFLVRIGVGFLQADGPWALIASTITAIRVRMAGL
jgi:hypothetical protein